MIHYYVSSYCFFRVMICGFKVFIDTTKKTYSFLVFTIFKLIRTRISKFQTIAYERVVLNIRDCSDMNRYTIHIQCTLHGSRITRWTFKDTDVVEKRINIIFNLCLCVYGVVAPRPAVQLYIHFNARDNCSSFNRNSPPR